MRLFSIFACLAVSTALGACVPVQEAQVSKNFLDDAISDQGLPAMQTFASGPAVGATRSNAQMAQDFLDLEFRMESGRALPVLTRFEGPITVALTGNVPPSARGELARVISRFRTEAGLNISAAPGAVGSITIDFQPRANLRRAVPSAACFTVPNMTSFNQYVASRGTPAVDWTQLSTRTRVAIFVPSDTSPQEVRDCLHEELAQAMGPLNDLYRLTDSIFNDDNFQSVLTGFDMLMLRAHYSPELRSGMNEAEVAARLPALLARLNPVGQSRPGAPKQLTARTWISAAEAAFGGRTTSGAAATRMMSIARAQGYTDGRLAFSYFALARSQSGSNVAQAIGNYTAAAQIWRAQPGGAVHAATVDMQLGAFALTSGQFDQVLMLTDRAIPVMRKHQNASVLSSLLAMRAEALSSLGRDAEAQSARLDSQSWARYAFGSDAAIRARLGDIAQLGARGRRG